MPEISRFFGIIVRMYFDDHPLELTFRNGEIAELDFRDHIIGRGGGFEPLEKVVFFKCVWILKLERLFGRTKLIFALMFSIVKLLARRFLLDIKTY